MISMQRVEFPNVQCQERYLFANSKHALWLGANPGVGIAYVKLVVAVQICSCTMFGLSSNPVYPYPGNGQTFGIFKFILLVSGAQDLDVYLL